MDLERQGYGTKSAFCDSERRLQMVDNAWEKQYVRQEPSFYIDVRMNFDSDKLYELDSSAVKFLELGNIPKGW